MSGFTLVEVMMAATFLVVGFIGMIEAVKLTTTMMDHGRRQHLASQIINDRIEKLRLLPWDVTTASPNELSLHDLPTASTAVAIDRTFWPNWKSASRYVANSVVTYNGAYYRCTAAHLNQVPTNTSYWSVATAALTTDIVLNLGATYTLTRTLTNPDPVTNIREANFTVTWVVKTSRRDGGGSPLSFTYTLKNSAWFGKYGLHLSYQRS